MPNSAVGMMGHKYALALFAALVGGAIVVPGQGAAQCRLCDAPTTTRDEGSDSTPLKLEIQAELDFDRLILIDNSATGTARIHPDGSQSTSGSVGSMTGRAMVGSVLVRGEPGRTVRIDLPRSITLHGRTGGTLELGDLTSDLPAMPRLDAQGTLHFRFGGELRIVGDIDGDYRGDIPITVEYL